MTGFAPRLAHVKHEEAVIIIWGSSTACRGLQEPGHRITV